MKLLFDSGRNSLLVASWNNFLIISLFISRRSNRIDSSSIARFPLSPPPISWPLVGMLLPVEDGLSGGRIVHFSVNFHFLFLSLPFRHFSIIVHLCSVYFNNFHSVISSFSLNPSIESQVHPYSLPSGSTINFLSSLSHWSRVSIRITFIRLSFALCVCYWSVNC